MSNQAAPILKKFTRVHQLLKKRGDPLLTDHENIRYIHFHETSIRTHSA